jgi:hypothetical protein
LVGRSVAHSRAFACRRDCRPRIGGQVRWAGRSGRAQATQRPNARAQRVSHRRSASSLGVFYVLMIRPPKHSLRVCIRRHTHNRHIQDQRHTGGDRQAKGTDQRSKL